MWRQILGLLWLAPVEVSGQSITVFCALPERAASIVQEQLRTGLEGVAVNFARGESFDLTARAREGGADLLVGLDVCHLRELDRAGVLSARPEHRTTVVEPVWIQPWVLVFDSRRLSPDACPQDYDQLFARPFRGALLLPTPDVAPGWWAGWHRQVLGTIRDSESVRQSLRSFDAQIHALYGSTETLAEAFRTGEAPLAVLPVAELPRGPQFMVEQALTSGAVAQVLGLAVAHGGSAPKDVLQRAMTVLLSDAALAAQCQETGLQPVTRTSGVNARRILPSDSSGAEMEAARPLWREELRGRGRQLAKWEFGFDVAAALVLLGLLYYWTRQTKSTSASSRATRG